MDNYDDIIDMPHHVSAKRTHISPELRAAQFAPFAALTGYDNAIRETARMTDKKIELDETEKAVLDEKLSYLLAMSNEMPVCEFVYYVADSTKSGGAYVSETGSIKKIDEINHTITLTGGTIIPIDDILQIISEQFEE